MKALHWFSCKPISLNIIWQSCLIYKSNLKIFSISMLHSCFSVFVRHTASLSEACYWTSWCLLNLPIIQIWMSALTLIYPYHLLWNPIWINAPPLVIFYLCCKSVLLQYWIIFCDVARWLLSVNWEWCRRKPVLVFGWRDRVEPQWGELLCSWGLG